MVQSYRHWKELVLIVSRKNNNNDNNSNNNNAPPPPTTTSTMISINQVANIQVKDMVARSGIIHSIDALLIPGSSLSSTVQWTPNGITSPIIGSTTGDCLGRSVAISYNCSIALLLVQSEVIITTIPTTITRNCFLLDVSKYDVTIPQRSSMNSWGIKLF